MRAIVWKLQNARNIFLRPFLTNPSSGTPLAHMDGIRALAVLLVVVFHVWVLSGAPTLLARLPAGIQLNFTPLVASGFIGVQLFFVLIRKDRLFTLLTGHKTGFIYLISGVTLEFLLIYTLFPNPNRAWAYYSHDLLDALGFTLILAGILFGGQQIRAAFSILPLRFIGIISYSIYLWHLPLIHLFNSYPSLAVLNPQTRFALVLYASSGAVLLLAAGSYLTIEKPFMLVGRQRKRAQNGGVELPKEIIPPQATPNTALLTANTLLNQTDLDQIGTLSVEALSLEL